jgi:hypothetical protein
LTSATPQPTKPRIFTVDQANAMLPLVRAIVRDWSALAREVIERHERLSDLSRGDKHAADDPLEKHDYATDYYTAELRQMRADLATDTERLTEYVVELRKLGVEPGDAPLGIVDFPSQSFSELGEARPIRLCWKLDEPTVQFWHDPTAGFAGRKPLPIGRKQVINDN